MDLLSAQGNPIPGSFNLHGTVSVDTRNARSQLTGLRGELKRTQTDLKNLGDSAARNSGNAAKSAGRAQVQAAQQAARQAFQAQQQADRLSAQSARQSSQQRAQAARDAARVTIQAAQQAARAQIQAQQQAARAGTQATQQAARAQTQAQQQAARLAAQASRDAARETSRNSRQATQEAGRNSREAARESARNSREAARVAQQAANETARIAREAARESARQSREAAKAAERAARETTRAIEREARAQTRAKIQADRELDRALQRRERERAARAAREERQRQGRVSEGRAAASQLGDRGSQAATRGGLAIAGGLALATREAILWESAFTGVTKTVNATDSQLTGLAKSLREMALQIPVNANELAGIAESAGQLGIEFDNLKGFTETIAALSVSTNLSSEEGATSMAKFANVTRISQTQFSNLGSSLVDLGNNFATTEKDIMEMSQRLSAAGTLSGLKAPDILAFATALSSVGINAEAGGTAVSKAFTIIDTAARGGGEELAKFAKIAGMSGETFQKSFKKDAGGTILEFIRGLNKVKNAGGNLDTTLKGLGMKNAYILNAMKSLANNPELLARALKTSSTAWKENTALAEEAGKRYKTSASQIALSQNNLREFGIIVGTTVVPALVSLLNSIKPAFEWFRGLDKETQSNYVRMAALASGFLLVTGRIKPMVDTVMLARTALIGLRAAWIGAAAGGGSLAPILAALSAVAFPAVVIAAGAATLAVGLWAINNEKAKETAARLQAANAGLEASATMVGKSFDKLGKAAAVNPNAAAQVKSLREQYEKLSGTAGGLEKFKKILDQTKGSITVGIKGAEKATIDKEIGRLQRDVDRAIGARKFKADVKAEANKGALANMKTAFMQTFGEIYTAWKSNTIDPIVSVAKWGWGQVSYVARESWRGIKIGWKSMTSALKTSWYDLTGGFDSAFNVLLRNIAAKVSGFIGNLASIIKSKLSGFWNWYTGKSANYGETNANAPSIPAYAVGSPNVPKTEVALVHKGEMIIPAKEAAEIRAGRAQAGGSKGGSGSGNQARTTTISVPMPGYMKSLFAKVGQETKVECGQAISNALGSPAFASKVAQGLAGRTVRPDRNGRLPDGAVVSQSYGKAAQHFFVVYTDRNGVQRKLESTTAGGKGRSYRSDRKITKNDLKRITRAALPRGVSGQRIGAPFGGGGPSWNPDFDGSQYSNNGAGAAKAARSEKPFVPPYVIAKKEADEALAKARLQEADAARLHAQKMEFAAKNGVGPALDQFGERLDKINSLWRDDDSPVVKLFKQKQFKSANRAFEQLMAQFDGDRARKADFQNIADVEDARKKREESQADALKKGSEAFQGVTSGAFGDQKELAQRGQWILEGKSLDQINTLLEEQTKWRERVATLREAGYEQGGAERVANETQTVERQNRALRAQMDAEEERARETPALYQDAIGKLPSLTELVAQATQQLNDAMSSGSGDAAEMRSELNHLPPVLQNLIDNMEHGGLAADALRYKYSDFFQMIAQAQGEIDRREAATADEAARPLREAGEHLTEIEKELDRRLRDMGAYGFKDNRRNEIMDDLKRDGLPVDRARVDKIVNKEAVVRQLEDVKSSMHSIFGDAFRQTEGGFKGMFDNIMDGWRKMLTDMAAEYLANWATQKLMGLVMGSFGGGAPSMGGGTGISLSGGGGLGGSSGGFMGGGAGLGGGFGLRSHGSFATGLDEVPFDGFVGTLHRGEAVLNRQAATQWRREQERDGSLALSSSRGPSGESSSSGGGGTIINLNGPITIKSDKPEKFAGDLGAALPKREMQRRGRNALGVR